MINKWGVRISYEEPEKGFAAVGREIKALTKKVENLNAAVDKIEKPGAIKKSVIHTIFL